MTRVEAERLVEEMRDFIEGYAEGEAVELWEKIKAAGWHRGDIDELFEVEIDDLPDDALNEYVPVAPIPDTTRAALVRSGALLYGESGLTYGGLCRFVEDELTR